jgi:hypothetical protein
MVNLQNSNLRKARQCKMYHGAVSLPPKESDPIANYFQKLQFDNITSYIHVKSQTTNKTTVLPL